MKCTLLIFGLFIFCSHLLRAEDTIKVSSGWNNIGAIATRIVSQITSVPPGIINSYYFGYTPAGYSATDTLTKGKGYWVKATQAGILLLQTIPVDPCGGISTISYEGSDYTTASIGTQCWLKENLNFGTMIPGTENQTSNGNIEKYCYNDDPDYCRDFGGLYQWGEAMAYKTTARARGLCPVGWHIPSIGELATLNDMINGDGNSLKNTDQGTGDGNGTNTSGFSALLSGSRFYYGNFINLDNFSLIWSSSQFDAYSAHYFSLSAYDSGVYFYHENKTNGFSIRCLKN